MGCMSADPRTCPSHTRGPVGCTLPPLSAPRSRGDGSSSSISQVTLKVRLFEAPVVTFLLRPLAQEAQVPPLIPQSPCLALTWDPRAPWGWRGRESGPSQVRLLSGLCLSLGRFSGPAGRMLLHSLPRRHHGKGTAAERSLGSSTWTGPPLPAPPGLRLIPRHR